NASKQEGKNLADLYKLLLDLVEDMTSIQKEHSIIASKASTVIEIHNLLLYLEENIIAIQEELEDDPGVVLEKYGEMGVKKIRFTGERLPLIPNLSPQQLHEVFVKNLASTDQCPCLEQ
ncbi:40489_t:CDS:2, partial [Gigaspora margarita]